MSDNTPPAWQPPTNGDPAQRPSDPKAEAAAAKAYAKAQRPWYKKKRYIIPLAFLAVIIIASAASAGSGGDKGSQKEASNKPTAPVTNAQKESPAATPTKAAADNSSAGKGAITWGNWEVVGRLQVTKEEFSKDFAVVTRVRNTGTDSDEGFFTVTILKGEEVLGTADCSTSTVQPGAIGTADCISTDNFKPGFTEVTIEDAF